MNVGESNNMEDSEDDVLSLLLVKEDVSPNRYFI